MQQLLLINPSPRKKGNKKMAHKKHRTAAQKAATRRMIAANRAKHSGGHKRRKTHAYASNPAPRKRRAHAHHAVAHHRKYRRNPSHRAGIMAMFMPSLQGAGGALVVDLITGYVPLPLAIKVSPARHLIKGVLAIGLGMVMKGTLGQNMAKGALTVAIHDAGKEAIQIAAPSITLGAEPTVADLQGVGYYNPAETGIGFYPHGMAGIETYAGNIPVVVEESTGRSR
jgi:hypothetical protein